MNLKNICVSEKGMALTSVVLIVMVGAILFTAFASAAYSNVMASQAFADAQRTKYIAEAGMEIIIKELSADVSDAQKAANKDVVNNVNTTILNTPQDYRYATGDIKIDMVNNYKTDNNLYIVAFNTQLDAQYGALMDTASPEYLTAKKNLIDKWLSGYGDYDDATGILTLTGDVPGKVELEKILYIKDEPNRYIELTVKATLNDGRANIYEKIAQAKIMLLPDEAYKDLPYTAVYKSYQTPQMFETPVALVAQGDIFFKGSAQTTINGNVVCFGTIPKKEILPNVYMEDMEADEAEYNGIIFGNTVVGGADVQITGSAATMSYIKIMGKQSKVTIGADAFARTFLLHKTAYKSNVTIGDDLYTTDDLQIDSEESNVSIDGNYYGMVMTYNDITAKGDMSGDIDEANLDMQLAKRTSSVVMNGLSRLRFGGKVFIGGTTYIKSLLDGSGNMYPTGYSALKTSQEAINAFIAAPGKKLYELNDDDVTYIEHEEASWSPYAQEYYIDGNGANGLRMFDGWGAGFNKTKRAEHIRGMWEREWEGSLERQEKLNLGSIILKLTGGKVDGYSLGAILGFDIEGSGAGVFYNSSESRPDFTIWQKDWIRSFQSAVLDFIRGDVGDYNYPKLNHYEPSMELKDYVDIDTVGSFAKNNLIATSEVYRNNTEDIEVYYGKGDFTIFLAPSGTEIQMTNGILNKFMGKRGIIYIDGDITIESGVTFNGTIIATGDITVNGGVNINRNTVNTNIQNVINNDVIVRKFFRLLKYDVNENALTSQRINTNTCRVVEWHENRIW